MVQSIVLTGPTAVGKTSIAIEFAERSGLEIINADSVCFYRGFDIGSAKPSKSEQARVPHHLIDIAAPEETYHAGRFWKDCSRAIEEIHARGKRALIVGGSGFYLKALRFGLWDAPATSIEFRETLSGISTEELHSRLALLDPEHAIKTQSADRYRIIRALEILELSGQKPSDRSMLGAGWIEEATRLRLEFPGAKALGAVGYRQILEYLDGTPPPGRKPAQDLEGLIGEIALAHRQLAKQQRTWFKNTGFDREFLLDRDEAALTDSLMKFYQ